MAEPLLIASAVLALARILMKGGGEAPAPEPAGPSVPVPVPPARLPPVVVPPLPRPPPAVSPSGPVAPAPMLGVGPVRTSTTAKSAPEVAPVRPGGTPAKAPGPMIKDRARLDRAAALAKEVAENVKQRGKGYDRKRVANFQKAAGLPADGMYGPKSAGAVRWYTGESVPPQTGQGFAQYAPNF